MGELKENVIEWYNGDKEMGVTLNQRKYINRVQMLAKKFPDMCRIIEQNSDGSIYAKISLRALHLTIYGQKNDEFDEEGEEWEVI